MLHPEEGQGSKASKESKELLSTNDGSSRLYFYDPGDVALQVKKCTQTFLRCALTFVITPLGMEAFLNPATSGSEVGSGRTPLWVIGKIVVEPVASLLYSRTGAFPLTAILLGWMGNSFPKPALPTTLVSQGQHLKNPTSLYTVAKYKLKPLLPCPWEHPGAYSTQSGSLATCPLQDEPCKHSYSS